MAVVAAGGGKHLAAILEIAGPLVFFNELDHLVQLPLANEGTDLNFDLRRLLGEGPGKPTGERSAVGV
jgi:hypothetical protein